MTEYIPRHDASVEIIETGRELVRGGYVVANDGNLSCLIGPDRVLATPTGVSKGRMTGDMLSVLDLDGDVVVPGSIPVSSEVKMHLRVYRENSSIRAVVHAHPLTATAFAVAGIPLDDSILTESVTAIGSLPVARFAVPGTMDVPESVAPFCTDYNGALLANHGVVTWGDRLRQAYFRLEWAEQTAKITLLTRFIIGKYNTLSEDQIRAFMPVREKLGIRSGGEPACVSHASNTEDVLPRHGLICDGREDSEAIPVVDDIVSRVTKNILAAIGK